CSTMVSNRLFGLFHYGQQQAFRPVPLWSATGFSACSTKIVFLVEQAEKPVLPLSATGFSACSTKSVFLVEQAEKPVPKRLIENVSNRQDACSTIVSNRQDACSTIVSNRLFGLFHYGQQQARCLFHKECISCGTGRKACS
ncbi:hypothetical protein, partial [Microcoleus sp. B13-B4]|uniref:hypothetical protein n=1 Tax=Microcoleus sp. B13-B4 TaxID=2818651 RepID=UPI002FD62DAC